MKLFFGNEKVTSGRSVSLGVWSCGRASVGFSIVTGRLLLALVCVPTPVCGPEFSRAGKCVELCLFSSAVRCPC